MKNTIVRLLRILVKNSIKIITLLLAVSIVSFTLVSISPIEPVQQYLLGLGWQFHRRKGWSLSSTGEWTSHR